MGILDNLHVDMCMEAIDGSMNEAGYRECDFCLYIDHSPIFNNLVYHPRLHTVSEAIAFCI